MNNAFLVGTRQAVSLQDRRRIGSTPAASAVLLLACVAICAASPIAHSAETEKTPAPKLSEMKPEANPDAPPQPAPKTPASKAPDKKPADKPAPGHAFDGAASEVETIRPVGTQTAALATLLESLKKGELTPTAAFENKQMTGAQALELLADTTIGTLQYRPLVHDLAAIVATKAPELIADVEKVAPQAKVRLAPYFLETRDPRAVPFYESILASLPQPPGEKGALPVFKLSDYYAAIGDYKKAAETRLRMKDYTTNPQFLANSEVEAARFYMQIGEEEKAQQLYEGASGHGYGWASGLAIYDKASFLIEQGKHEEARKLLLTPVSGQYSEQIQVALLSLLSRSFYNSGKWSEAESYANKAITHMGDGKLLRREGLEENIAMAQAVIAAINRWRKNPLSVEPSKIEMTLKSTTPKLVRQRIRVFSFRSVPLTASCENPNVKVYVQLENWGKNQRTSSNKEVILEINITEGQKELKTILTIGSPEDPDVFLKVPVSVKVLQ